MTQGEAGASPQPLPAPPFPPAPAPASTPIAMALPLRVEVTFEYTFDELREGLTQSPDMKPRKGMEARWSASSTPSWLATSGRMPSS